METRSNQELLVRGKEVVRLIREVAGKVVFGSELQGLIELLIIGLFANGHVVSLAPVGVGKTYASELFARIVGGKFSRIQFRADMLPSEITGYEMYNQKTQEYEVHHGPLFEANVVIADEINRGTPKAQSGLLESMGERRITIGNTVFPMEDVFIVLATENPMEQEGTYPLPEAQLDRIFAIWKTGRVSKETLYAIARNPDYWRPQKDRLNKIEPVTSSDEIVAIREAIFTTVHVEERLSQYIVDLVDATWEQKYVEWGSSPRGVEALQKAATIAAFLAGERESNVEGVGKLYIATPEDVQRYAAPVLAHRIIRNADAQFKPDALSTDDIVREVLHVVQYKA